MSFAAAIERANAAVFRHLAERTAVLDHVEVTGIFDNGHRDALGGPGVAVTDPTFTLPSASCTRVAVDTSQLRVPCEGLFRVAAIEPGGTGVTVLRLQKAR